MRIWGRWLNRQGAKTLRLGGVVFKLQMNGINADESKMIFNEEGRKGGREFGWVPGFLLSLFESNRI
jgi:hypothetical protein